MATRLKLEEVDLVVAAMTIARDVGGNLALRPWINWPWG